jgi:hypothetical protein
MFDDLKKQKEHKYLWRTSKEFYEKVKIAAEHEGTSVKDLLITLCMAKFKKIGI